jgi:ligand-binding SRPBCC domain-containing protein
MRVRVATVLQAPMEAVWAALQTPSLLQHVAAPLLVFRPVGGNPFPTVFPDGRLQVAMRAFGVIPLGRQWIDVSRPKVTDTERQIRDNGSGSLVARWDHLITIRPLSPVTTDYEDAVEIEAGLLTPLVWAYAQVFYRWRQHRWRALARRQMKL